MTWLVLLVNLSLEFSGCRWICSHCLDIGAVDGQSWIYDTVFRVQEGGYIGLTGTDE